MPRRGLVAVAVVLATGSFSAAQQLTDVREGGAPVPPLVGEWLESAQAKGGWRISDDGTIWLTDWTVPSTAFTSHISESFIHNEFLGQEVTTLYPENAIMGFSGETCPGGWAQLEDDDGALLYYAFGLLVDENGQPRSEFVRIPACVKQ